MLYNNSPCVIDKKMLPWFILSHLLVWFAIYKIHAVVGLRIVGVRP